MKWAYPITEEPTARAKKLTGKMDSGPSTVSSNTAFSAEGYLNDPHMMVNRIEELLENSTEWYVKSQAGTVKEEKKSKVKK